jgi:1-acyl-sn-glycerol-3-phosphate acyltransferase
MLLRLIGKFLLWLFRWKYDIAAIKGIDKCVLIVVPHTSIWDLVYGKSVFEQENVPVKFAIKKEAFYFPMGIFLRWIGGIPIDRSPNKGKRISLVDAMANTIVQEDKICMVITPEGSRSVRHQWRTGFYYVALKANVPIALGFLDFKHKRAIIDTILQPSGDIDKDMRFIMDYYGDKIALGKKPGHSRLDERWS